MSFQIERIYLDERAENDWVSQTVLQSLSYVPVEKVSDKRHLIKAGLSGQDPIGRGKKALFITPFYGRRLKSCPGTSHHICCGYHVINALTNCPMDCSYCVLQEYLNNPFLTLYSNWDDLLQEIEAFLSMDHRCLPRLGTGELSDSLALDMIFPVSQRLVSFFAEKQRGILELKTKSAVVDHLLHLEHRGRTVVSWSLNAPQLIEGEEIRTASLGERLLAAKKCQEQGYPVGFHFDPLIHQEGWEEGYQEAVQELLATTDAKRIAWVSLGAFRYPPRLKSVASRRFSDTGVFLGELFPGRDGKIRYLQEIRVEMYRKMVNWLRDGDSELFIYLCMESREVWEKVFGWSPESNAHLNHLFERQLQKFINQ